MEYPELTVGLCIYKRPYYTTVALMSLVQKLGYAGKVRFHLAGVESESDLAIHRKILSHYEVTIETANNLSAMCNSIAHHAGDVWLTILDDYVLREPVDLTPDVKLLLNHSEIGCVRLACLSLWGSGGGNPETNADLIELEGLHWWRIDKARTKDSYVSGIFCHLYHRRFWNDYGDIPLCSPENPGQAELNGAARFRAKNGSTIAIPMRFGENTPQHPEPFWHFGMWHADAYAKYGKERIRGLGL